ncbi:glycerophosphodiester phosphodiesterase family protein [Oceanobacillus sp. CAU 1775]
MVHISNLIFAHRGASKYAPENTFASFSLAEKMHADGIETDIQLTKDGIPILIHDESLKRTTGVKSLVKNYKLVDIQKLDAGRYFSNEFYGSEIMTLDAFLKWASSTNLILNLELKNNKIDYEDIEHKTLQLVDKYKLNKRIIVSSFNPKSIERVRALDKHIDIALLRSKRMNNLAQYAVEKGASSLHINYRLLNRQLVKDCEELNLPLRVYTVNRRRSILRCLQYECDSIITDVPDKAIIFRDTYNV